MQLAVIYSQTNKLKNVCGNKYIDNLIPNVKIVKICILNVKIKEELLYCN